VKNHTLKISIFVVAVRVPVVRPQINFHIAGMRRVIADLQKRVAKIRPAFVAGEAGMKDPDDSSVRSFQFAALEPLMLPNGLQQAFGRELFIAQKVCGDGLRAPLRIEILCRRSHLKLLLRFCGRKVKFVTKIFERNKQRFCLLNEMSGCPHGDFSAILIEVLRLKSDD
jgi:hypothetical protein